MIRSSRRRPFGRLALLILTSAATVPFLTGGTDAAAFSDAELIDASVTGVVFVDFDRDGRVDIGETAPDIVSGQRITVASTNRP